MGPETGTPWKQRMSVGSGPAWGIDLSGRFGQGFGTIDVDAGHVLQRHDDPCRGKGGRNV